MFVEGYSYHAVAARTGVPETTLKRWGKRGAWNTLRRRTDELGEQLANMAVELARAAAESGDANQTFAARDAARLIGVDGGRDTADARVVARAFIEVLSADPELAELQPLLRKYRKEIVRKVADAAERMEAA